MMRGRQLQPASCKKSSTLNWPSVEGQQAARYVAMQGSRPHVVTRVLFAEAPRIQPLPPKSIPDGGTDEKGYADDYIQSPDDRATGTDAKRIRAA